MNISIPKGTKDMLPSEAYKWHFVESKARETAALFGFREFRTPTFEHTELSMKDPKTADCANTTSSESNSTAANTLPPTRK